MPTRVVLLALLAAQPLAAQQIEPRPVWQPGAAPLSGAGTPGRLPGPVMATVDPVEPGPREDLVRFDYNAAQVRWAEGRWELHAGGQLVKDFGGDQQGAREALLMVRRLRLTQRGTVGSPAPIMEYWLADGQAPQALGGGLTVAPIDTAAVTVQQVAGSWCVVDPNRLLFNFGARKDEADQALAVIRKYNFNRIGYVGYPRPAMIYFLGDPRGPFPAGRAGVAPPAPVAHGGPAAGADQAAVEGGAESPAAVTPAARQYLTQMNLGMGQLAPPVTGRVLHVRFDPREVQLRYDRGAWRLYHGGSLLADFGAAAQEAQQFQRLLREYRVDEQHVIGRGSLCYFLTGGRAPLGVRYGLQGQTFRPDRVTAKEVDGHWYVARDDGQPVFYVSDEQADAEEMVQAIRRYQFDFYTRVGSAAEHSVPLFLRTR